MMSENGIDERADGELVPSLSPKEVELLGHLAGGVTLEVATDRMGIAYATGQTYVVRIRLKLRAKNTTEAVAIGLSRGLISVSPGNNNGNGTTQ